VYTVEGFLPDGGPYAVAVGTGQGNDLGDIAIAGDDPAVALLLAHEGETFAVTPTGPISTLSLADHTSVLAALHAFTTVTAVKGDPPDVFGPIRPGVVH
jgi:hypothetical protein